MDDTMFESEDESIGSHSLTEDSDDAGDAVAMTNITDLDLKEDSCDSYEMLAPEEITTHMNELIRSVEQVVRVPPTSLRLLLTRYNWDKDRLLEHFFESSDPEQVFREAHLISPSQRSAMRLPPPAAAAAMPSNSAGSSLACWHLAGINNRASGAAGCAVNLRERCEICFNAKLLNDMTGLGCGHYFCRECWVRYLTGKIVDENQGEKILCPALNCNILVDDAIVFSLLEEAAVRKRFQKLITNSFVMCNRLLTWCPGVECGYAVRVLQFEARRIKCRCGEEFCFACGETWHDPVRCRNLKRWIKKMQDDSETSNWISANTKECPKCHVTIEKDGGCNHMVCKKPNCKYEFCWVCLDQWEPHGSSWYQCNRYDEKEAQKARDAQGKSRAALQRYLFYFNRYANHFQSLKLEHKLYDSTQKKMEEMQSQGMSWIEVQFLKKAVDVLCLCRRTLMYTYVFAYYMKKNNQMMIFESNQSDLEMATEQLSEYLERDITKDSLTDIKQKVQDKSRYCENRRKVMLDHVHEGYEKDMWEPSDCL